MSREQLTLKLLFLAEMFDTALSETRITGYLEALDDLPEQDVLSAMDHLVRVNTFFPRVAEIRNAVAENRDQTRERARREKVLDDARGRRIEAENWERERKARGKLPAPIPIGQIVKKISAPLTEQEIEARKAELQNQARMITKDSEETNGAGAGEAIITE